LAPSALFARKNYARVKGDPGTIFPHGHSGALAKRANPESRYAHRRLDWIPGSALRAAPE